jgi:hypothetical protein
MTALSRRSGGIGAPASAQPMRRNAGYVSAGNPCWRRGTPEAAQLSFLRCFCIVGSPFSRCASRIAQD